MAIVPQFHKKACGWKLRGKQVVHKWSIMIDPLEPLLQITTPSCLWLRRQKPGAFVWDVCLRDQLRLTATSLSLGQCGLSGEVGRSWTAFCVLGIETGWFRLKMEKNTWCVQFRHHWHHDDVIEATFKSESKKCKINTPIVTDIFCRCRGDVPCGSKVLTCSCLQHLKPSPTLPLNPETSAKSLRGRASGAWGDVVIGP